MQKQPSSPSSSMDNQFDLNKFFNSAVETAVAEKVKTLENEHVAKIASLEQTIQNEKDDRTRLLELYKERLAQSKVLGEGLTAEREKTLHERELREAAESELRKLRDRVRSAIGDGEGGRDHEDAINISEAPVPGTAEQNKRPCEDAEDGGESPAKRMKLEDGEIDEEQEIGHDNPDETVQRAEHEVLTVEDGNVEKANASTFQFRRPDATDSWWSVSQTKWDNNTSVTNKYRWTRVGRAQELGAPRTGDPCGPCVLSGDTASCFVHPTHKACGRCLWNKNSNGTCQ